MVRACRREGLGTGLGSPQRASPVCRALGAVLGVPLRLSWAKAGCTAALSPSAAILLPSPPPFPPSTYHRAQDLERFSREELREFCRDHELYAAGSRADLAARINEFALTQIQPGKRAEVYYPAQNTSRSGIILRVLKQGCAAAGLLRTADPSLACGANGHEASPPAAPLQDS